MLVSLKAFRREGGSPSSTELEGEAGFEDLVEERLRVPGGMALSVGELESVSEGRGKPFLYGAGG